MKNNSTKLARPLLILALLALMAITVASVGAAGRSSASPVSAPTGKAQSYVVIMEGLPLAAYDGEINGLPATKATQGQKLDAQTAAAKSYDAHLRGKQSAAVSGAGLSEKAVTNTYTVALNGFSAIMTEAQVEEMRRQDGVQVVLDDQWRQPETDSSGAFLGLTGSRGAWHKGITGEGVLVGVIDSGIWPEHLSFADNGTFPDAPVLDNSRPNCEFGNTAHNANDVPFTCNNKLVGARQMLDTYRALIGATPAEYDSARDDNGHGTHTASTAAGNSNVVASIYDINRGKVSGIAPRAQVVAYKGLGALGGFTSDLAAAIDQAVADGVDVINYSVGGGAAGPGADELAFLFAADAGVYVATSAGNSGPAPATMGNPGTMPWMTTVGASTQSRFFQGTAVLGGEDNDGLFTKDGRNGDKDKDVCGEEYGFESADRSRRRKDKNEAICIVGASITPGVDTAQLVDAEDAGGDLCIAGTLDPAVVAGKIVLCRRGAIARAEKSRAVYEAGGVGMIMYNNSDDDNLLTDTHWVPSVHVDLTPGLAAKAYIDDKGEDATAKIIGEQVSEWPSAPSMTIFSSRGPNPVAPDIIKPDITAPGAQVLAGYTPTPEGVNDVPGQLFAAIQGTSMSSPEVAGAFALLRQAHPDWSPAMAKSAIMTSADQNVKDNDRVSQADPFDMGSGHLNLGKREEPKKNKWSSEFQESLALDNKLGKNKGHKGNKGSSTYAFEPGLVYDAGFLDYLGFLCDAFPDTLSDPAGTCGYLESIGVPTDATDLNYPSIAVAELAGSQTVQRTVTSVAKENGVRKYKVYVDAPDGYEVEVSPSSFNLKRGESATYEVTITNVSGPVGEWRFGSLTWKDKTKRYQAYSPIAVKGALFNAPAEVGGSGTSGAASFDVSFGYTGSYAAAAHGLTADAPVSDDIGQDPDQTYPSGDDGTNGGVVWIDYPVTGAAFVRWEMVIEGDDDIDLYLEDSAGNIVAQSTSGGTDELIEMFLPADDTYTMAVHGWSVPNAPLPFTLHFWEVPLASGGSLSVDSAPASAVIGEISPVDVSWSGLSAGTRYLGAVSHTGDVGLMGLTLVEVDTQ